MSITTVAADVVQVTTRAPGCQCTTDDTPCGRPAAGHILSTTTCGCTPTTPACRPCWARVAPIINTYRCDRHYGPVVSMTFIPGGGW